MAYPQLRASIPSNATDVSASSQVCTHPTGLTAGDLMILVIGIKNSGANRTVTTPSGWTVEQSISPNTRTTCVVFKKVATSGDVSAGSTTVSFSGTIADGITYAMFAVTGTASGLEVSPSEQDTLGNGPAITTITGTTALTPITPETLVFSIFFAEDTDIVATITASSFSLTPSTTLTERVDVGFRNGLSDGVSLMIATGEYAGLSQITSRAVTVPEGITGYVLSVILLINAPVNVTADVGRIDVSPTIFAVTASEVNVSTDISRVDASPTINGLDTQATAPTQWQNEATGSTAWVNEQY